MRRFLDTLGNLSASAPLGKTRVGSPATALTPLLDVAPNPGALLGFTHVPPELEPKAPLVVVLHGCTQTAASYDRGSGWSRLATEQGFAVLFVQQQRANNPNLCFNWFERADVAREGGEAQSIAAMTRATIRAHDLDPARVFVTGLSAGGAMTAVMLSAYPDLFAGGAVIAGLPYGGAPGVQAALQQMRRASGGGSASVRGASRHKGRWPTLSVWHGDADRTVDRSNAEALVAQWRPLHGVADAPARREHVDGHDRDVWIDREGRDVIESWTIAGLGHGTPLATTGADACGAAGPHMLEAGISSTRHIARFWGLHSRPPAAQSLHHEAPAPPESPRFPTGAAGPQKVIEDALRAAGLMR